MRYLISALCTGAVLFGVAPSVAAAATVGCGRVTTFTAPNSAGSNVGGDGWLIYAKPDGTSDKVIIRSGTVSPSGSIAGYVCLAVDGIYLTGVLAPGTAGYIPEPAAWVTGTGVYCGTVAANPFTSGQLSGPDTLQLAGPLSAYSWGIFRVPPPIALPQVGGHLCGRFEVGGPSRLLTVLRAGDAGYVAAGLPNTSTSGSSLSPVLVLGSLAAVLLVMCGLRVLRRLPEEPGATWTVAARRSLRRLVGLSDWPPEPLADRRERLAAGLPPVMPVRRAGRAVAQSSGVGDDRVGSVLDGLVLRPCAEVLDHTAHRQAIQVRSGVTAVTRQGDLRSDHFPEQEPITVRPRHPRIVAEDRYAGFGRSRSRRLSFELRTATDGS